jgi:acyl-CoA thioesterase-1
LSRRLLALALTAAFALPAPVAFAQKHDCRASRDVLELSHSLDIAKAALEQKELRIVAMGSSSTQGYGTSRPEFAYPAQLKLRLEAALPGVAIHVYNKGIGGQDADEMAARMKSDVSPQRAHLVIWQVGTNSAIRRTPLTKFGDRLRAGIDIGKSLGADFILMNLQYVPAVVALPDEEDYARVMSDAAREKNAGLFRRFEIMREWYRDGMPYAQFVTSDGLHLNDFGQKCIAKLLSKSILDTIRPKQLTDAPIAPK